MTDVQRNPLTPEQQLVLMENTLLVATTDLAEVYNYSLRETANYHENIAALQRPDPIGDELQEISEQERKVLEAHMPFAFKLQPSNLAVSLHMIKVSSTTGEEIPRSDIQIALVNDNPAEDGPRAIPYFGGFGWVSKKGAEIALGQLYKQKEHGLVYGLAHTAFLADY